MEEQLTFDFEPRPTIKGFPGLRWTGKRPYRSTRYYPAQLRGSYGEERNEWMNDIWTNDEYLQFMYERLLVLRELLSEQGSIFVHCDWHRNTSSNLLISYFCRKDILISLRW